MRYSSTKNQFQFSQIMALLAEMTVQQLVVSQKWTRVIREM
jgi:hypothetical protein